MKYFSFLVGFIFFSPLAHAFDMGSGLTPPKFQKTMLSYSGLFRDSADFPVNSAHMSTESLDFSTPVYRTDNESYTLSLNSTQLRFSPAQGDYSQLADLKVGLGYSRVIDEQSLWSLSARYGSASNKPFSGADVSTFGVTWMYSYPSSETGRWLLLLDYSNNRPILNNIPLPGFAYFWTPSKDLKATFGVPFASVNWSFTESLSVDIFTVVPWIFKGSLNYKINEYARLYTGVDFSQMTFYLADRVNKKDRLFYDEKKIFIGAKSPLSKNIFAELEVGHAFDRTFFVAEEYAIDPENPFLIGNAYYGKVSLRLFF